MTAPIPSAGSYATARTDVGPVGGDASVVSIETSDLRSGDLGSTPGPFPAAGGTFAGFHLVEELGRGAFGRVFLAHQGELSGRPVAVKIARDIFGESQKLAQLQHANIVPIYSYHRSGPWQAVCMPYLGRTTLAGVLAILSDRNYLPQSGRELKSTLARQGSVTVPEDAGSDPAVASAGAGPAPAATAGWDRLDDLSYADGALWLAGQLADGLAHAHRRGILHCDLKPANVLLTDDGRAMLLDFNLAEDVKTRAATDRAAVGGTLPYMAPEQLRLIVDRTGRLDDRADVFALGVVLYELLTGRHPFPRRPGPFREVAKVMLADRLGPPPDPRAINPAIPPAAAAIVRRCLAPNRDDRYRLAEHVREDIDRHLSDRPLKYAPNPSVRERLVKWTRRHPRLSSAGSVATLAATVLVGTVVAWSAAADRAKTLDARARFADHRTRFAAAQLFLDDRNQSRGHLGEGRQKLDDLLAHYGVGADEAWRTADAVRRLSAADREQLQADVGETYFRLAELGYLEARGLPDGEERTTWLARADAWHEMAARVGGDRIPVALTVQRAALDAARERKPARVPDAAAAATARDLALVGGQLAKAGRHRDALVPLQRATLLDPTDFSAWFVRGTTHLALEQNELAAMCFGAGLALRPDFAPAWRNRGLALSRLRFFDRAVDDFDRAVALAPDRAETYLQRAAAKDKQGNPAGAEADYSVALALGSAPVRAYFLRADVRDRRGDPVGARADRDEGLRHVPGDELSWVARAEVQVETDPTAALSDVEQALEINPLSLPGLQMKAHILAERLHRDADAVKVLDRAVELFPDAVEVRAGRGVLHARSGDRAAAHRDAKDALLLDGNAPNLYQVGCIYALTAKSNPADKADAFRHLWAGLKTGFGLDLVDADADLDGVRSDPEFLRLVERAKALRAARGR